MAKEFDAHRLDVRRFAEAGARLASDDKVGNYERLVAETEGRGADWPLRWSAHGELRNPGHLNPQPWLHLKAHTALPLTCQRCLAPVDVAVAVDRSFRFVADEATAAAQDDEAEEDVLAASRSFDLVELVEDELLMALPVAPRHEACPTDVTLSSADAGFEEALARKDNPFAALARLKAGKS